MKRDGKKNERISKEGGAGLRGRLPKGRWAEGGDCPKDAGLRGMCSLSDTLRDLLTGRLPSLLSLAVNSPAAQTTARCQLAAVRFPTVTCDSQERTAHFPRSSCFSHLPRLRHHFPGAVGEVGVYAVGRAKKKKHSVFDACPELHNSLAAAQGCRHIQPGAQKRRSILRLMPARSS